MFKQAIFPTKGILNVPLVYATISHNIKPTCLILYWALLCHPQQIGLSGHWSFGFCGVGSLFHQCCHCILWTADYIGIWRTGGHSKYLGLFVLFLKPFVSGTVVWCNTVLVSVKVTFTWVAGNFLSKLLHYDIRRSFSTSTVQLCLGTRA